MITIKINVSKIDKARLFKGEKGTYLDAILIPTPNDKYGQDYMIVESISKEERDAGAKGTIIGGGKNKEPKQSPSPEPIPSTQGTDDLPF